MANTKSAMKRIRQNEKRRLRNRAVRSQLRTAVKTARAAQGDGQREVVLDAIRLLDKAVTKGVVHRTRAPERAIVLMVETAAIVPTGDA